jgi:hypothetical protein
MNFNDTNHTETDISSNIYYTVGDKLITFLLTPINTSFAIYALYI